MPNQAARQSIRQLFPAIPENHWESPFRELGIDSFDFITLRTELERATSRRVPDQDWVSFRSFADILSFYGRGEATGPAAHDSGARSLARSYQINMPQMAVGGLGEPWLFRELGDLHWSLICQVLGRPSDSIVDQLGNRLYPTFVRLRAELGGSLVEVRENDTFTLSARLSRYGKSMFFGAIEGGSARVPLRAETATTFAMRHDNNKQLAKGEPPLPPDGAVAELPAWPTFSTEYRELRSGLARSLRTLGHDFSLTDEVLFRREYRLNPYTDLNGVNLLYFATYPLIADTCERDFAHHAGHRPGGLDWALASSTTGRDVFYYANCDVDDVMEYRLHSFTIEGHEAHTSASLWRLSDGKQLAQLFTRKALRG